MAMMTEKSWKLTLFFCLIRAITVLYAEDASPVLGKGPYRSKHIASHQSHLLRGQGFQTDGSSSSGVSLGLQQKSA